MALAKWQQDRLDAVLFRLDALCAVGSSCAVDDEHKEGVRIYVQSWIIPHMEVLCGIVERGSCDDLGDRDAAELRRWCPPLARAKRRVISQMGGR